jgi:hypothetical protein
MQSRAQIGENVDALPDLPDLGGPLRARDGSFGNRFQFLPGMGQPEKLCLGYQF